MTAYAYRAVGASGQIQKGCRNAGNENELAFLLHQLGLELIEAKPRTTTPGQGKLRFERADPRERLAFCSQMSDFLTIGLPFDEALRKIAATLPPGLFQTHLSAIAQAIEAGSSVKDSFAAHPVLFDSVFLALLEAGERSGHLAGAFARLTRQEEGQLHLRRALKRALRYPLFLLCVACGVTSFMMGFVVPEIVSFLTSLGTELPLATRLLIASADVFAALWWLAPALALGLYLALIGARHFSVNASAKADALLLRLPGIGPVLRSLALARFATSFATLNASGLALPSALKIASGTLGNRALVQRAGQAATSLGEGLSLSQACATFLSPFALQMIRVGEQSGALGKTLENIAAVAERDAQDSVESFLGLLEPALTALVGGLLAWIVLAVLGPVYGSLGPLARGI